MFSKIALILGAVACASVAAVSAPATNATAPATASPAPAPASTAAPVNTVAVGGAATCAAIALDGSLIMSSWEAKHPTVEAAEFSAVQWCNTGGFDPSASNDIPGADCIVAQSWCDPDLCSAIAAYYPTDALTTGSITGSVIAISSVPSKSMSVAMLDALLQCTQAACDSGVDCSKGAPICFIQQVVCSTDAFQYQSVVPLTFFTDSKPLPNDTYMWFYANTTVTGTIANLHY